MKRWLLLNLKVLILLTVSCHLYAQTGVAFVHGKGAPRLAQLNFAWGYWSVSTVKTITRNFKIPSCMAHYDGTLPIPAAADVVAKQLVKCAKKKKITDLVIETHSYGGVISRWIFSHPENPLYRQLIRRTRWVNTLAAPQLGSKAADAATILSSIPLLGHLISWAGEDRPSTRSLTTFNMAYLNEHFMRGTPGRPKTARPFYTIAGIGVLNDWYKLHIEDYLLKVIELLVPFRLFTDGVVCLNSAEGAGIKWFRTKANHFHIKRGDFDGRILKSLVLDLEKRE